MKISNVIRSQIATQYSSRAIVVWVKWDVIGSLLFTQNNINLSKIWIKNSSTVCELVEDEDDI